MKLGALCFNIFLIYFSIIIINFILLCLRFYYVFVSKFLLSFQAFFAGSTLHLYRNNRESSLSVSNFGAVVGESAKERDLNVLTKQVISFFISCFVFVFVARIGLDFILFS